MYTCMRECVTLLYSRKWTEHCKPAIMEKYKKHYKTKKIFLNKFQLRHVPDIGCWVINICEHQLPHGCISISKACQTTHTRFRNQGQKLI